MSFRNIFGSGPTKEEAIQDAEKARIVGWREKWSQSVQQEDGTWRHYIRQEPPVKEVTDAKADK